MIFQWIIFLFHMSEQNKRSNEENLTMYCTGIPNLVWHHQRNEVLLGPLTYSLHGPVGFHPFQVIGKYEVCEYDEIVACQ